MLEVRVICVGKLKEAYWRDACAEYAKRLGGFCRFSIVELPESRLPDDPSQAQIDAALRAEGEKILAAAKGGVVIPLCIEGQQATSEQLSAKLDAFALDGHSTLCFVIGSSFGLDRSVKQAGSWNLSMSRMTFPHQLARVMLCEQLYRAFQISHGGKYHK